MIAYSRFLVGSAARGVTARGFLCALSVQQGVKLPSPCTLVQAVVALVQEALPGLSPADLAGILSLRALKPTGLCGADLPEELKQAMEEAEPDAAQETT